MTTHENLIRESVIRDMAEGLFTLDLTGRISYVNPAAERLLARSASELTGQPFARCFFGYEQNDAFNQLVMDAVYDKTKSHDGIVDYYNGEKTLKLRVITSFLMNGDEKVGIIAVLNDMTELVELRDAMRAFERIQALNAQLELRNKLLSETFGRFLSDEIVRQLLDTPDGLALGGRKRTITIMMSDLRGFTAMSERMKPHALIDMLNHYLGEMTEIIQKHSGTIIEFIGDGIMAIYGAPLESDTNASDAVAAAIEMQAKMPEINRWNAQYGYPKLEMGIGINTGAVIVGNIGSEKRTKYGVVGSEVNLCGRIESYTVGGQVLISPLTRELLGAPVTVAQEMEIYPKGADRSITVSQVTALGEPYNVSCGDEKPALTGLDSPRKIDFSILDGKHGSAEHFSGVLTALGDGGAMLQTAKPLARFDNLILDIGAQLFAKVLSADENGALLRFTSVPPEFDAWKTAER